MIPPRVILASGSAIRRQIMLNAGIKFDVIARPIDEAFIKQSMLEVCAKPSDIAAALAEAKAMHVSREEPGLVIGADQIMVMDDKLYDKPATMAEARERLMVMRGKVHYLIGAVVICRSRAPVWRHLAKTKLTMRDFSDEFLDEYLENEGEQILKSVGAYRFEGPGAQLFSSVEGDFFSILGLSLLPVLDYLRSQGVIAS